MEVTLGSRAAGGCPGELRGAPEPKATCKLCWWAVGYLEVILASGASGGRPGELQGQRSRGLLESYSGGPLATWKLSWDLERPVDAPVSSGELRGRGLLESYSGGPVATWKLLWDQD